jgi:hypothetical protein
MPLTFKPRNDLVVLRRDLVKRIGQVNVPENSAEAQKFYVVEAGPKVEGLKAGDRVLFGGTTRTGEVSWIPGTKDLLMTRQENILCVIEGSDETIITEVS